MKKESLKSAIHYLIKKHSKDRPIKSSEIKRRFGCSDVAIRESIHELRSKDCVPICSGNRGYFYPSDLSQAQHTYNHLTSRSREMISAAKGIKRHFEKDNQLSIV